MARDAAWRAEGGGRHHRLWAVALGRGAHQAAYSLSADVYSVGVLLWAIGARAVPFAGRGTADVVRSVKAGERPPPISGGCPPPWQYAVDACVAPRPEARPSAAELAEVLNNLGWLE